MNVVLDPRRTGVARTRFPALGTTAALVVTEAAGLPIAARILRDQLDELSAVASRFRTDSELNRLYTRGGRRTAASPLLVTLLAAALRAAALSDGLVDPTVGQAVIDAGYDRDVSLLDGRCAPVVAPRPATGWECVELDERSGEVTVPDGVRLDLGATAKAVAADRAADALAAALGCGVLVELGGDLAVRGPAPDGGWLVQVGEDARGAPSPEEARVAVHDGALATSSTTARTWRRGTGTAHHVIDPRTGDVAATTWRTVTVAGRTCVDANTAATAAVVLGTAAPAWLTERGLPARLVGHLGWEVRVAGWPDPAPVRPTRTGPS